MSAIPEIGGAWFDNHCLITDSLSASAPDMSLTMCVICDNGNIKRFLPSFHKVENSFKPSLISFYNI